MRQPEEALEISAPFARRLAAQLCRKDAATGETCAWSHGLWQYLRILGLATEPAHHGAFLRAALAEVAAARRGARLLLSGSADYALLAQALPAVCDAGADITVLDICETPLALNRWYADRCGAAVRTQRSDILEFSAQEPFDAVCTHAFLGYFDAPQRVALLAKWRSLLRAGGRVITVNRLRPGATQPTRFSSDQVRAYRERVLRRAEEQRAALDIEPAELARLAQDYASRLSMHPIGSAEEMRTLFEGGGFALQSMNGAPLASAAREVGSVPTMPSGDEYLHVVAIRR